MRELQASPHRIKSGFTFNHHLALGWRRTQANWNLRAREFTNYTEMWKEYKEKMLLYGITNPLRDEILRGRENLSTYGPQKEIHYFPNIKGLDQISTQRVITALRAHRTREAWKEGIYHNLHVAARILLLLAMKAREKGRKLEERQPP